MYIYCLLATYYTSPESWGPCLSFCDDNDNDKDTHKDKYKDKDGDDDIDKVVKRPITCYIFEKQGVQGYQMTVITKTKTQGYQVWWWWVNQWCITEVDAPEVMHHRWCTRGDASEVMNQRWCTRGDAPCQQKGRWYTPTRVECFPDLLGIVDT